MKQSIENLIYPPPTSENVITFPAKYGKRKMSEIYKGAFKNLIFDTRDR
jgi:hypothetical protein